MSASGSGSEDLKASPAVSMANIEKSKLAHKKNQTLVLVPQPSDDPQDPLVSPIMPQMKLLQQQQTPQSRIIGLDLEPPIRAEGAHTCC